MAPEMKGRAIGAFGKIAEIDGGYIGGYVKPANNGGAGGSTGLLDKICYQE
jgi:hypothetical protein